TTFSTLTVYIVLVLFFSSNATATTEIYTLSLHDALPIFDEFQDTSRMQWTNFKPLVDESLSSGNFNLIVGDVKQSIYRFRNSDWRLLEEQVEKDFSSDYIRKHVLDTNWRSDAAIVEFNNFFFNEAPYILQDYYNESNSIDEEGWSNQISSAYTDVHQHLPEKIKDSSGHVKIT